MSDDESRFITSVAIERSRGPHAYVSIWIRHQQVGTLCVGEGDAEPLRALLMGDRETLDRIAAAADKVMGIDVIADNPDLLERAAESVQVEERRVHTARSTPPVRRSFIEQLNTGERELDIRDFADRVVGIDVIAEHPELVERAAESVQTEERRLIPIGPERLPAERLTPWMRGSLDAMRSVPPPVKPGPFEQEILNEWCRPQVPPGTDPRFATEPPPMVMQLSYDPAASAVVKHHDWRPEVEVTEYPTVPVDWQAPVPSRVRKHQGFVDDPVRTPVFAPLPALADALGQTSSEGEARARARRRVVECAPEFVAPAERARLLMAEARAETVLAESLAEAGQDVVLEADGREFPVHPSVVDNLDAMNQARARVGMPALVRKGEP